MGLITCGGVPNCVSRCWNDVIGFSSSSKVTGLVSPRLLLHIDVTDFVSFLLWIGWGVSLMAFLLLEWDFSWNWSLSLLWDDVSGTGLDSWNYMSACA